MLDTIPVQINTSHSGGGWCLSTCTRIIAVNRHDARNVCRVVDSADRRFAGPTLFPTAGIPEWLTSALHSCE